MLGDLQAREGGREEEDLTMRGTICHKDGLFFAFSNVSDMVSSPVLPRAEFEAYCLHKARCEAQDELAPRIERAIAQGSSSYEGETVYDVVRGNAERVSLKKILERADHLGGMDFATALGLLKDGVRVRRKEWNEGRFVHRMPLWAAYETLADDAGVSWDAPSEDILADDWEVAA